MSQFSLPGFLSHLRLPQTKTTAVVDPYDPPKLQAAAEKEGVQLGQFLLTTHGHHDHAGGNEKTTQLCVPSFIGGDCGMLTTCGFVYSYPNIKVYAGGQNVSAVTEVVRPALLPLRWISPLSRPGRVAERIRARCTAEGWRQVQDWRARRDGRLHALPVRPTSLVFSFLRRTYCFFHRSTRDHICYYIEDKAKNERAVFTGSVPRSGVGAFSSVS